MRIKALFFLYFCSLVLLGSFLLTRRPAPVTPKSSLANQPFAKADRTGQARMVGTYGKLPLSFEMNRGQTGAQVKFLSRGSGYSLFLTSNEAVLALRNPSAVSHQPSAFLRLRPGSLGMKRSPLNGATFPGSLLPTATQ